MSYDIGGGYDGWRTATPWDDEVAITVSFDCGSCEAYNENIDAITGSGCDEVEVECEECGIMNNVDI